ncbi:MAG TPA: hypothetical protein VHR66_25830 [Gemmataceae bacterium]|jgi:hypothetical protein|nr:hypothetical protein [Gemmataceae bacterium]
MTRGLTALIALGFWVSLAHADEIHKDPFSGKSTRFVAGESNVKVEEKAHDLSAERSRSLPTSERIRVNLAAGKNESNFAYYNYTTPVAPLTEDLSAELWVHSSKPGVQLLARVVFPKIRNPKQLDEPLTRIVKLDDYKAPAGGWQKLILKRPADLLQAQKQALRLELKGDPDITDAYIDRLILNLYTGQGEVEVFVDNLEIGPVKPAIEAPMPPVVPPKKGSVAGKEKEPPIRTDKGIVVDFNRGDLTVGGRKVFPRFIRYSGTPMLALKEAGFNGLSMPTDIPPEVLEDAIDNYQFWIVPHLPPVSEANPEKPANPLVVRDADALIQAIRKFQSGDGVLFWDLGPVRSEDYRRVSRTAEAIRTADPRRPIGADVWDGFGRFSIPLQMVGTHRDPLLTSLDLDKYGQWLNQRKNLATGTRFYWTWIQTHIPDWQFRLLYDRPSPDGSPDPVGPQPEQIRLLTYLAIASGCKAIGYWSDKYLADAYQGRERLLQLAILNQEIEMLEPILLNLTGDVRWVGSSNPFVKVAVMRTNGKGLLAIPIWLGGGAQYVPPQAAVQGLSFTVPQVPDGSEPWEVTPVRVQSLQPNLTMTPEGVKITLPEFDLTAAVVFTTDTDPEGLLATWQKKTRQVGQLAAAWACDLADEEFAKVMKTHARLEALSPPVEQAPLLIHEAERKLMEAKRGRLANNDEAAYLDALRALRPLRVLMRLHWERAIKTLDFAGATPYSVSFYTLPRHWELAQMLQATGVGENMLRDGNFDGPRPAERRGVAVTMLPGWTVQEVALDDVIMKAVIVPPDEAKEEIPVRKEGPRKPYETTSILKRMEDPMPPKPVLGTGVLRLTVTPKPVVLQKKDDKAPPEPAALERVFLCVNSPPVRLPPGSWVRISGWMKVADAVRASPDGAMFFDTTGGEAYAARVTENLEWKHFHMYRKVPANGEVRVRMALTGFGTVYFDDIKVEPYLGTAAPILPPPMKVSQSR